MWQTNLIDTTHTLWCLIEGGVGISGGLEKSPKHNKRVGWDSRGFENDATI